jgi:hypothetical protein
MNAMQDVPIVKAAVAYDDHITGEMLILVINQALYFGSQLLHILLNQNQMRAHGLTVEDCPKHSSKGKSRHAIILEENDYEIPLKLHGIMSYFDVRTPTKQELLNCTVLRKVASTTTLKKQLYVKSEDLAKRWMVGLTVAQNTI